MVRVVNSVVYPQKTSFIIHRYIIKYKNGLDGLVSGIYEGLDAVRANMSMPLGKKMYNNTVFVYISVSDSLGAFTTVETSIQVNRKFGVVLSAKILYFLDL